MCKEWSEYLSSDSKHTCYCGELRQTITTNIIKKKVSVKSIDSFFGKNSTNTFFKSIGNNVTSTKKVSAIKYGDTRYFDINNPVYICMCVCVFVRVFSCVFCMSVNYNNYYFVVELLIIGN